MTGFKRRLAVVAVAVVIAIAVFHRPLWYLATSRNIDITVTGKERVLDNDGDSRYVVWGKDANGEHLTFENTDSMWYLKFNSSDIQGSMVDGSKFTFKTVGVRFGPASIYPNIIEARRIN